MIRISPFLLICLALTLLCPPCIQALAQSLNTENQKALNFWEPLDIDGIPYVSLDKVRAQYGFATKKQINTGTEYKKQGVTMRVRSGSQEMRMNDVLFILSHRIIDTVKGQAISVIDLAKILHPVLMPKKILSKTPFTTVVIDPGHGGSALGATNRISQEKDLNLQISLRLQKLLVGMGFNVIMTRTTDIALSLQDRVNIANRIPNAIFISIHCNAGGSCEGIETFTLAPTGTSSAMSPIARMTPLLGNMQDAQNIALATAIQGELLRGTMARKAGVTPTDRGIKRARYSVLCTITHPAVLVECGFMSNAREAQLLTRPEYQDFLAGAIATAVKRYKVNVYGGNTDLRPTGANKTTITGTTITGTTSTPPKPSMPPPAVTQPPTQPATPAADPPASTAATPPAPKPVAPKPSTPKKPTAVAPKKPTTSTPKKPATPAKKPATAKKP